MGKKAERNRARYEQQVELRHQLAMAEPRLQGKAFYGIQPPPDLNQSGGADPHFKQGGLPSLGKKRR